MNQATADRKAMENKENTQPKFTPGPWRRSAFEDDWAIRDAKCDRVIARPNCNFDDASANAALIAAAPEMYYLLCNILNDLETDGSISLNDNAANDIRGLLAKARGEAETCKG